MRSLSPEPLDMTEVLTDAPILFTPGPLNTTATVKAAMMHDVGSRDAGFIRTVERIRHTLLQLGHVSQASGYECVLMQGSGTFGIESVLSSAISSDHHLVIVANGAYGERMVRMATVHGIPHSVLRTAEDEWPTVVALERFISAAHGATHLAVVHSETTTGILNPIEAYGQVASKAGLVFMVDAMSSFGAVQLNLADSHIDFLVSSSNKCIQGVPGFSFILASRNQLMRCEGRARTLSLDLFAQWKGLETDGQFRFTPPTHALLAFGQALDELEKEGGPTARYARYARNQRRLSEGMCKLGFQPFLPNYRQGPIITSFRYPESDRFNFSEFYRALSAKGCVIYPGKLSKEDCFRIGSIGDIDLPQIDLLLRSVAEVKQDMSF